MARIDPTAHAHPAASGQASGKHPDSVLKSLGKAIFAPMAGAHDGVALPHTHADAPAPAKAKPHHPSEDRPRMLSSIAKAMLAPIEGSHGGLSGVARHRPATPLGQPGGHPPDERDPRVVGQQDDNPLESLGKAVVAPVEGADEGAGTPGSMPPKHTPK
jgi:hypothetical protein